MEKKLTITMNKEILRKEILEQFLKVNYPDFNNLCDEIHEKITYAINRGNYSFSLSFKRPKNIQIWKVLKEYLTIQGYEFEVITKDDMPTDKVELFLLEKL